MRVLLLMIWIGGRTTLLLEMPKYPCIILAKREQIKGDTHDKIFI